MADSRIPAPTGKTKDAGWEVGVRKTVDAPLDTVWAFLLASGLPILSYTEGLRVRLTWQPGEWNHDSTLQLTVKEAEHGTTIAFHQERLSGREERKIMLGHWKDVVQQLDDAIAAL
jgi:hypothetical protein